MCQHKGSSEVLQAESFNALRLCGQGAMSVRQKSRGAIRESVRQMFARCQDNAASFELWQNGSLIISFDRLKIFEYILTTK